MAEKKKPTAEPKLLSGGNPHRHPEPPMAGKDTNVRYYLVLKTAGSTRPSSPLGVEQASRMPGLTP